MEIKFRFWLGHTKKMTYEHTLIDIANFSREFTEDIITLQYVGLEDKEGVDIFRGDIVEYKLWNGEYMSYIDFESGSFGLRNLRTFMPFGEWDELEVDLLPNLKVIGNIYENVDIYEEIKNGIKHK